MTTKRNRRGIRAQVDAAFEAFCKKRGMTTATWRQQKHLEARRRMHEAEEVFSIQEKCPHGNPPASCNACMIESDFQYDVAREDRLFGK